MSASAARGFLCCAGSRLQKSDKARRQLGRCLTGRRSVLGVTDGCPGGRDEPPTRLALSRARPVRVHCIRSGRYRSCCWTSAIVVRPATRSPRWCWSCLLSRRQLDEAGSSRPRLQVRFLNSARLPSATRAASWPAPPRVRQGGARWLRRPTARVAFRRGFSAALEAAQPGAAERSPDRSDLGHAIRETGLEPATPVWRF